MNRVETIIEELEKVGVELIDWLEFIFVIVSIFTFVFVYCKLLGNVMCHVINYQ